MLNKIYRKLTFFLLLLTSFLSCKRKDNTGNGLVPDASRAGLFYTDTLTLLTRTVAEDSLITSELTYNILGASNDPVFDQSRANVFLQYLLPRDNFSFSGVTKFDSAVLYLNYMTDAEGTPYYGSLSLPQRFTVHEMQDGFDPTRMYYSNSFINYNAASIGTYYGPIRLKDSITIKSGSTTRLMGPALAIKLDDNWVKSKLILAPGPSLSSNSAFLNYLKGLAVISESAFNPGEGGFFYVNSTSTDYLGGASGAGLVIYYNDSLSVTLPVNKNGTSASRRLNTFYHPVTQPSVPRTYAYTGSLSNTDTAFIQAMGRYKLWIRIPYLSDLAKDQNIAVNSAELVLKPYPSGVSATYYAPPKLRLLQPDSNGRNDFIKDLFYSGNTPLNPYYGGTYNSTTNEYHFNLTMHIQSLLNEYAATGNKSANRGLYVIIPTDNPIAASRLILDTRKGTGIKFKLYYTVQK
jgi:hypothetical protein